jgi:hypothetical protein
MRIPLEAFAGSGTLAESSRNGRGEPLNFTMNVTELHVFYEELVQRLRERGVVCGITSGLACVHYGIAETTQDCDLLCHTRSFEELLDLLSTTPISGNACHYRGNLSPPLDARWHRGGWTSHFEWGAGPDAVTLDVFGRALRESTPWEQGLLGLYAGPHTVAEMKRTNRDKDWAVVTALGLRMIEADDDRGWLHIFNADTLTNLLQDRRPPTELVARRPALQSAVARDPQTAGALNAERRLWEELDRRRIQILESALRPYVAAVRKVRAERALSLREDHEVRVDSATQHLPPNPLKEYGLQRYIGEARAALVDTGVIPEGALTWLPEVGIYFEWLNR